MPPPTLDEHVFGEILSHCNIYHVLKFTEVSKWCRSAALSKQLWISLIRDLEFRGLRDVDPTERLEDCSTQDLIAKAKRVTSGPRTWSPSSPTPPTLEREVLVNLGPQHYEAGTFIVLLPGGKHFALRLYLTGSVLSIWAVSTQRCIWSRIPRRSELSTIHTMDGGETVVIASVVRVHQPFIHAIEVDLRTGSSSIIFQTLIPRRIEVATSTWHQVAGEHLAFSISTQTSSEVHLVNWVRATYTCLQFPMTTTIACTLVPGLVSVVHLNGHPERRLFLSVYTLDSLDCHPIASWDRLLSDTPAPVSSLMVPFVELPLIQNMRTFGRRSPIRREAYKFTLHVLIQKPPSSGLVSKLWDKLWPTNQRQGLQYSFVFVQPRGLEMVVPRCLSPGHRPIYAIAIVRGRVVICDISNECRQVKINDLVFDGPSLQLGTHSTALPLVKDDVLRIMYFE